MYNFYPGPSKIYPEVKNFAIEAFQSGILERNHRSELFMELLSDTIRLFKHHLNIPEDYKVFFISSATEGWEICAQSFFGKFPVNFYYNGAFGEKWMVYTQRICGNVSGQRFGISDEPEIPDTGESDICMVVNETSNGSHINLSQMKRPQGEGLLALDVVSSLGGVNYDFHKGDIWIASVQKCLGLPSGLGIMIVSPHAMRRAVELKERNHYNSVLFINENFSKFQTPYTPNILGIYLLKRNLEQLDSIYQISESLKTRAKTTYDVINSTPGLAPLIENETVQSPTVITVKSKDIFQWHNYFLENGVIVGKGYGQWRDDTFRIANFPAIKDYEFEKLFELIRNFVS